MNTFKVACDCICHKDGQTVMHMIACCDLCYEKFYTVDGVRDESRIKTILSKRKAEDLIRTTGRKPRHPK